MQRFVSMVIVVAALQASPIMIFSAGAQTVSAKAQAEMVVRHRKCITFMKATPYQCDPACDPLCRFSIPSTLKLPSECDPPPDRSACPQTK
jgi:hypothetical protein